MHAARAICLSLIFSFSAAGPGLFSQQLQTAPIEFIHDGYQTPELALLRDEFLFDETVSRARSELERMIVLKDWVFRNVDFRHNYRMGNLRDALQILRLSREGVTFHCSHFAAVYLQSAVSLGWTARYYFLRNIKDEEHAVNEIWSNELSKWIFIDVTWNLHIEKDGVPLNLLEIRGEWLKNDGEDLVYIFGAGPGEARYTSRDFPVKRSDNNAWRWWPLDEIFMTYAYEIALIGRNDFFSREVGGGDGIWDIIYIIKDDLNEGDRAWSFRKREDVDDERAFYHDVNRVDIEYESLEEGSLLVSLDAFGDYNYTPNLDSYLIRLNGGIWKPTDGSVVLKLRNGKNRIEARVRNLFGVLGPIAVRTVETSAP